MPIHWWFAVKFVPGGHGTFHAMLNSFVHILMYSYYGFSSLGTQYQKYFFWKKYLTSIQMVSLNLNHIFYFFNYLIILRFNLLLFSFMLHSYG